MVLKCWFGLRRWVGLVVCGARPGSGWMMIVGDYRRGCFERRWSFGELVLTC